MYLKVIFEIMSTKLWIQKLYLENIGVSYGFDTYIRKQSTSLWAPKTHQIAQVFVVFRDVLGSISPIKQTLVWR